MSFNNQLLSNIYLSIYLYIILTLMFIIFLQIINNENSAINSIQINSKKQSFFKKANLFLFLSSLIGIPPLLGFLSKILIFIVLASSGNYYIIIIGLLINAYLMVFYLQQLKFNQVNKKKTEVLKNKSSKPISTYTSLILFQIINVLALFIVPNVLFLF